MTAPVLRRLAHASEGATIVEFALIAPVLMVTLMGIFDVGYNMYATTLLKGAIHQAARDSTLEGTTAVSAEALDDKVESVVHKLVGSATVVATRKSYSTFSKVRQPEDFVDAGDMNGSCDNGEVFEDANGNGNWDADRGKTGVGGARDAVLYTVTVSYPRVFPMAGLIGLSDTSTMSATTVLRNQPYGLQAAESAVTGNCP
jgi:Flp pilus assembly protein TadG